MVWNFKKAVIVQSQKNKCYCSSEQRSCESRTSRLGLTASLEEYRQSTSRTELLQKAKFQPLKIAKKLSRKAIFLTY